MGAQLDLGTLSCTQNVPFCGFIGIQKEVPLIPLWCEPPLMSVWLWELTDSKYELGFYTLLAQLHRTTYIGLFYSNRKVTHFQFYI